MLSAEMMCVHPAEFPVWFPVVRPLVFKPGPDCRSPVVFLDLLSKPILVKRVLRYNSGGSVYKPQMCRGKAVGYHTA